MRRHERKVHNLRGDEDRPVAYEGGDVGLVVHVPIMSRNRVERTVGRDEGTVGRDKTRGWTQGVWGRTKDERGSVQAVG
jgi:hypothetical protein